MIGHLGTRVSALLDGRLGCEEEERVWAHVHECHECRDLVEREGWVKTRLAGLGLGMPAAPDGLKGSLLGRAPEREGAPAPAWASWTAPPGEMYLDLAAHHRPRRAVGLAAIGGGAVGAAMMGVLALGVAPAAAPTLDRRTPVPAASIVQPGPAVFIGPQRRQSLP